MSATRHRGLGERQVSIGSPLLHGPAAITTTSGPHRLNEAPLVCAIGASIGAPVGRDLRDRNSKTGTRFWNQAGVYEGARAGSTRREWSRGRELNPRPTDYESVALPLSYPGVRPWSLPLARRPQHPMAAGSSK